MQIQINTDKNIQYDPSVVQHVEDTLETTLGRFSKHLTRIEVHLRDENAQRGGAEDHVCTLEARPAGHQPVAVTDKAENIAAAITGAAHKMQRLLTSTLSH